MTVAEAVVAAIRRIKPVPLHERVERAYTFASGVLALTILLCLWLSLVEAAQLLSMLGIFTSFSMMVYALLVRSRELGVTALLGEATFCILLSAVLFAGFRELAFAMTMIAVVFYSFMLVYEFLMRPRRGQVAATDFV